MRQKLLSILTSLVVSFGCMIPAFAVDTPLGYSLVEDGADLLTSEEESELLSKLETIQSEQNMDVVVVTVNSLEGKTATAYADDYFDYNGYGQNESHDGILFLISMSERKWAISTTGIGITYFTDAGLDYMTDRFMSDVSDGNYFDAFMEYASLAEKFIVHAKEDQPYDLGHMPKHLNPVVTIIEIVVCFGLALMYCFYEKKKLKTIVENNAAMDYIVQDKVNIHTHNDMFVNQIVTSHVIQSSSSGSGGGGSSTHVGSSGTSHGGSSGRF